MVSRDGMLDSLATDEAKSRNPSWKSFPFLLHCIQEPLRKVILSSRSWWHMAVSVGLAVALKQKRMLGFYHVFRVEWMMVIASTSLPTFVSMSLPKTKKNGWNIISLLLSKEQWKMEPAGPQGPSYGIMGSCYWSESLGGKVLLNLAEGLETKCCQQA